jgi:pantothenate kinase
MLVRLLRTELAKINKRSRSEQQSAGRAKSSQASYRVGRAGGDAVGAGAAVREQHRLVNLTAKCSRVLKEVCIADRGACTT